MVPTAYLPALVAFLAGAGWMTLFEGAVRIEYVVISLAGAFIWLSSIVISRYEAISDFFLRLAASAGWDSRNVGSDAIGVDCVTEVSHGGGDGCGGGDGGGGGD